MDKSKSFDVCKFSVLFQKMLGKLSDIFLRIIIYMYDHQFSNVRWNSEISSSFTISNSFGQGKILAGFAYCFYCHEFFNILQTSGYDCLVKDVYAGIYGYSDDDILLAPSLSALSSMIKIAEQYFSPFLLFAFCFLAFIYNSSCHHVSDVIVTALNLRKLDV